ncbi:hypothetical protein [Truepera radiovictrix]|uniref:Uncharacterized protein n=1 Tax=Truepera radiovictrix (strain DSM 17093 / CIP 108686 / LMG 22925 / RQ-24) TaxID=649638 RepID=D7CV42_TRURR|nr:hypothetical protein [Truepera radiovictrix]ADI15869.1 conserved hypothetical protein [Truepera radiovictrix DSM 17093]WMT58505.1 hypothetical protein RCV51_06055 [Truepera radiovictrix]
MPRDALFDAAVNRAHTYAARLGLLGAPERLRAGLELWYLKTRFAYRVPFDDVLDALARHPAAEGRYAWVGGRAGGWRRVDA